MKLSSHVVALILLARALAVAAVECGKWFSNPCVCESDVKYCPAGTNGATDDILAQHPLWKNLAGFYEYEVRPEASRPKNARFLDPTIGFLNITIAGSRLYMHYYVVQQPDPDVDCDTIESGGDECDSECGFGCVTTSDSYATSTPERDGMIASTNELLPSIPITYEIDEDAPLAPVNFKQIPIDENTLFASAEWGTFRLAQSFSFTSLDKSRATFIEDVYTIDEGISYPVSRHEEIYTRLDGPEQFLEKLAESLEERQVREEMKPLLPMPSECNQKDQELCPTEEEWCKIDPACVAEPKYAEPEGTLKAGPIAGVVVAVAVVLLGLAALYHNDQMKKQAARNKAAFARRVADTIELEGPDRELTPEALAREFKRIDNGDGNGTIDRDELWNFVNSGSVAKMGKSDFNALFAALDTDGDGTVSFMEFCAYMGKAYGEFEKMKEDRSVKMTRGDMMDSHYSAISKRILEVA